MGPAGRPARGPATHRRVVPGAPRGALGVSDGGGAVPAISVVVPSHDRPLRLRWLLNALQEQTLDPAQWEVVVAHDSSGPETEELLRTHPLAAAGVLRHLTFDPGPGPAVKRNAGWRAARAPRILFTDDDCRPPRDWVANGLAAALARPDAILQGRTTIDPDELAVRQRVPHARSQEVDPPVPWAQTCNILYPRAVLEATGGFDESLPLAAGEDTDLALRARALGAPYEAAPDVLTYHCVEPASLLARMREVQRWEHLPFVVRAHPEVRDGLPGFGTCWKPAHARLPAAAAGVTLAATALARRRPGLLGAGVAAVVPWALAAAPRYGRDPRGVARSVSELPGRFALDVAEFTALARGSVRYRTLLL
ncbi:hypothetical protein C7Y72_19945 [Paraconexibacter algicola]|uniref:Glycosyltransferase 2-like domain-containing protein n=1 Tax=Paraconexibacter algicola TaxID=2133960 RepID=A0A2T4UCV9_9ACTN|nr:hypothetical protein C7Y72_19945 [Paraconexibacter algicola]